MDRKFCYFYLPDNTINDATIYYCNIVKESFELIGIDVVIISELDQVNNIADYTFSIRIVDFLKICKLGKRNFFWVQGVLPEENLYLKNINLLNIVKYIYSSLKEFYVLRTSDLNLFVSNSMLNFYRYKNLNRKIAHFEMPCFNQSLTDLSEVYIDKYKKPSFVYAGSLSKWQCVEDTILIFKIIKSKIPDATLTILSKDAKTYDELLNKHNVEGICLKYIPLDELQTYLEQFKYAFLLREKNIVNRVSTPTKMNSYLASNIIPIYSNTIDSFEKNINLGEYCVKVSENVSNHELIANQVVSHHLNIQINYIDLHNEFKNVFEKYYDRNFYIDLLSKKINLIN